MVVRATLRFFAGPVAGLLVVAMLGVMSPDPTGITVVLIWGSGLVLLGVPLGVAFATGRLQTRNTLIVIGGGQIVTCGLLFVVAIALAVPATLFRIVGLPIWALPGWVRLLFGLVVGVGATVVGLVVAHWRLLGDDETLRPAGGADQGS